MTRGYPQREGFHNAVSLMRPGERDYWLTRCARLEGSLSESKSALIMLVCDCWTGRVVRLAAGRRYIPLCSFSHEAEQ